MTLCISQLFKHDENNKSATFHAKLKPGAKVDLIEDICQINSKYYLRIKIKAPAIDGKANKHLIDFLSQQWKIKKSDVQIISGLANQYKTIALKNISSEHLQNIFAGFKLEAEQLKLSF